MAIGGIVKPALRFLCVENVARRNWNLLLTKDFVSLFRESERPCFLPLLLLKPERADDIEQKFDYLFSWIYMN